MRFLDKVVSKKGHLIHKYKAIDETGRQAYYFILIEPHKKHVFDRALQSDSEMLNFNDYGKVIASCYGDKPTEEVKKILKEKYDFDV